MPQTEFDYAGRQLFIPTSTSIQTAFVQQDVTAASQALAAAGASPPKGVEIFFSTLPEFGPQNPPIGIADSTVLALQDSNIPNTALMGNAAVSSVQLLLDSNWTYTTGSTAASTVVAADGIAPTIINNNANDALIGVTGAATQNGNGATLEGLAGANLFITGSGGRDAGLLDGAANNLISNGNDVVQVGGQSTITATTGGMDAVTMIAGTILAFVNQSGGSTVDSVTGTTNGIILLAGAGSTQITSGAGTEYDFVDTSAGNVTLNASLGGTDLFTFIKDADAATAAVQVNNFSALDVVALHGYATYSVQASPSGSNGALLSLSDGSQVSFNGLSASALQQAIRTV